VPTGDYVLCASNAAAAALNPCTWGGAPLIKMANGLHASNQAIRLAAGATLQMHLDDPGGLLAAHANKPGASLIVGLGAPYGFLPLPIAGSTATSRDYKLLVPFNTTRTLTISTEYFKLTNAAGVAIGAGLLDGPRHDLEKVAVERSRYAFPIGRTGTGRHSGARWLPSTRRTMTQQCPSAVQRNLPQSLQNGFPTLFRTLTVAAQYGRGPSLAYSYAQISSLEASISSNLSLTSMSRATASDRQPQRRRLGVL
jgi:hypothetical protein